MHPVLCSIPQTPHLPLPPRPHSASRAAPINVSLDANYFTPDISQKPGSELSIAMFPPPVPPLPQGGFTSSLDQVADHEPPPLPPRPKWFEVNLDRRHD